MHTEAEIRAARPLIEFYGELNTSEIKQKLEEVLDYGEEDKIPSKTRNEILITQRIGNIVTHQQETIKIYPEGFIVDKSYKPAHFFAIKGIAGQETKISAADIKQRKKTARQNRIVKINWELVNDRRTTIGNLGEKQRDGLGYDIASINEYGETIFIEVKTTTSDIDTPFYMSKNEKLFFETHDTAFIYRVYDFNEINKTGKIKIISAEELFQNHNFDSISFMVTAK